MDYDEKNKKRGLLMQKIAGHQKFVMYSFYYMGIVFFFINFVLVIIKTIIYFGVDNSIKIYEIPLVVASVITWIVMKILYSNPKIVAKMKPTFPLRIIPFMTVYLVSLLILWTVHLSELQYIVEHYEYWQVILILIPIFQVLYMVIMNELYKAKYRKLR
jgi:hypothetical protein